MLEEKRWAFEQEQFFFFFLRFQGLLMLLFRDPFKKIFFSSLLFWLHWGFAAVSGFLWSWRAQATLHWCVGFSLRGLLCGAQALGAQASVVAAPGLVSCGSAGPRMRVQKLWRAAVVALQHVGSSWARN